MLNISFDFGHPAQYLLFRNVLRKSDELGFKPFIFLQDKDVLRDLIRDDDLKPAYLRYNSGSSISRMSLWPKDVIQMRSLMKENKIVANFGKHSFVGSCAAWSLNRRSIVLNDTEEANLQNTIFKLFSNDIWTPNCYRGDLGNKHKRFNGIFQLGYLDPSVFKPNKAIPESLGLLERGKPIVIRIIDYQAVHDWNYRHLKENFIDIITKLEKDFDLLISVEGNAIPKKLKKYQKKFKPLEYLDILAHSALYVGSGQSSASEAAVLGVPSLFTNPVLYSGYVEMLEKKYKIIKSIGFKEISLEILKTYIQTPSSKWKSIREKIRSDFINVPNFMEDLIKSEIETYIEMH